MSFEAFQYSFYQHASEYEICLSGRAMIRFLILMVRDLYLMNIKYLPNDKKNSSTPGQFSLYI